MKILARIAVILAAALVVVAGTVALSNAGALNGLLNAGRFERERGFAQRPGFEPGDFARGEGRDRAFEQGRPDAGRPLDFEGNVERGRFGGFSLFGAFELARNLAIVLVIVAAAVVLTLIWQRLRHAGKRVA